MPEISATELAALRRRASLAPTDVDEIAKRKYQTITAPDGQTLCTPPSDGGPLTIGGEHPDDYFGADDKGVASKGF